MPNDQQTLRRAFLADTQKTVRFPASDETVKPVMEADQDDRLEERRRCALMNIPGHLFSKEIADLARTTRDRAA